MDWLFYQAADDAPDGPATVFTDRFWDHRERWIPPDVGTVPGSEKPYFGPLPPKTVTEVTGTDEEWLNGFSHEDFIAGKYKVPPCCNCKPGPPVRIREAQTVGAAWPYRPWTGQAQTVGAGYPAALAQAQTAGAASGILARAGARQAQGAHATQLYPPVALPLAQAQAVGATAAPAPAELPLAQAQAVGSSWSGGPALVAQAQAVGAHGNPLTPLGSGQAQRAGVYRTGVTPGATDATAAVIPPTEAYLYTTSAVSEQWWKWTLPPGPGLLISVDLPAGGAVHVDLFTEVLGILSYVGTLVGNDRLAVSTSGFQSILARQISQPAATDYVTKGG